MKKLYCVDVQHTVCVMAENEALAWKEARVAIRQEEPSHIQATLVTDARMIDPYWRGACPYNGDDEKTCAEIAKEIKP